MKLKTLLICTCILCSINSVSSQVVQQSKEQQLLDACLKNDFDGVFSLLGEGISLKESKEASFELYKLLQNQTKVKSGMTMVNFEVVKTEDYFLRRPEDNEIFTLLLRSGVDTSMYHIVGSDKSGVTRSQFSEDVSIISGGDAINDSRIVFQTDSGMNAFEYAAINQLSSFVEAFDIISFPLIHHICEPELVKQLLAEGADVNQVSSVKGYTALNLAAQHGNREILQLLLDRGANPGLAQKNGLTPISSAAYRGDVWLGRKLIEAGASIYAYVEGDLLPFRYAVINNNVAFLELLLENGLDPEYIIEEGIHASYYAAQEGYLDMLKMLTSHGADINKPVEGGQTALCIASYFGHEEVARYLVEKGAKLDDPAFGFNTPLMHAYTHGHKDLALYLLASGASTETTDENNRTILHFSAYANDEAVLSYLLKSGSDPDRRMDDGSTPLILACKQGHQNIVKLLLKYKANPEIADEKGNTPLLISIEENNKELAGILLDAGVDPDSPLRYDETALFTCIRKKDLAMADILLKAGADINARDKFGENMLFKTADAEMLRYLFRKGIKDEDANFKGETALTEALNSKNIPKAELLIELGSPLTNANTKIDEYLTDKAFKSYLRYNGATFKIRDERFDQGGPDYNFDLVLGMGVYAPKIIEKKSWPFNMGMALGISPLPRFKVNTSVLLNFMGVTDIYFTNLQIQPTLRYTTSPAGYYVGGGMTWSYLLGVSSSEYPEVSISDGFSRSGIAPYFTVGYEDDEMFFELGYRMRRPGQPGVVCINFGMEISTLFY